MQDESRKQAVRIVLFLRGDTIQSGGAADERPSIALNGGAVAYLAQELRAAEERGASVERGVLRDAVIDAARMATRTDAVEDMNALIHAINTLDAAMGRVAIPLEDAMAGTAATIRARAEGAKATMSEGKEFTPKAPGSALCASCNCPESAHAERPDDEVCCACGLRAVAPGGHRGLVCNCGAPHPGWQRRDRGPRGE